MAQSYSFFKGIPSCIDETNCIEQPICSSDVEVVNKTQYCKCGNDDCIVNSMSSIQQEQIRRTRDFDNYFPDLFLNDVPSYYTIADIYNMFNRLGDDIAVGITIVPGLTSNKFVVKFDGFHIHQDTYEKTICVRWSLYKNWSSEDPGIEGKWFELNNVSVFDSNLWNMEPRFGVEYHYQKNAYSTLYQDERTMHLCQYLKNTHFSSILTNDAANLIDQENRRIDQETSEIYNQYFSNTAAADADVYGLEDGEIDESHLYNDYDDEHSVDENYYHNYIYNIIEDAANVSIDEYVTEPENANVSIDKFVTEPETDIASSSCSTAADVTIPCENDDDDINEYMLAGHNDENDDDYYEDEDDEDDNRNNNNHDDDGLYEYCEISNGIWHRRLRYENEDPDELHYRINNATNPQERAEAFWN
jgi:hypothetical protein